MQAVRLLQKPARQWSHIRLASSASSHARPDRAYKFLRLLSRSSNDGDWQLLRRLAHPRNHRILTAEDLAKNRIRTDAFEAWKPVLRMSSVQDAANSLQEKGYITTEKDHLNYAQPVPPLLLLYLCGFKVRTIHDVTEPLMNLAFSNMNHYTPEFKGALLIFTTLQLSRFNLLIPMQNAVDEFLSITYPPGKSRDELVQFNLILLAISCSRWRSTASADLVVRVLRVMDTRQLHLQKYTYLTLLDDRFVTVELTKYLRDKMLNEGVIPSVEHLEAYARVFAKNGLIEDAKAYHEAVRPSKQSLLISSQPDRASAFEFLRRLSPKRPENVFRAGPARSLSIADFTSAFSVAAKDIYGTSIEELTKIFESGMHSRTTPNRQSFRPTVVTFTVFIRGLLIRGAFEEAEHYWYELLNSAMTLDAGALSVGLQAVTRAGKPHKAFATLDAHSSSIHLKIVEMNGFLVSLLRVHRPDVIFALWDGMGVLYGLQPDARTFSIVIQAAKLAMNMDDTVSGYFRQWLPRATREMPLDKEAARNRIKSLLYASQPGSLELRPYKSGIWNGSSSGTMIKQVFYDVLASYCPSIEEIRVSPVPAFARDPRKYELWVPRFDFLKSEASSTRFSARGAYPSLVPSDANFQDLLLLLGTSPATPVPGELHVPDIPLLLAWMREAAIEPSKETLAIALVLFREWNAQAPLVDAVSKLLKERDPYEELRHWVEHEWRTALPTEEIIYKWAVKMEKMRMGRKSVEVDEGADK